MCVFFIRKLSHGFTDIMKSKYFLVTLFTISLLMSFGCDQILNRTLESIKEVKENPPTLNQEKSEREELIPDKDRIVNGTAKEEEKPSQKIVIENTSNADDNRILEKEYNVIGTDKDGPYRSGEINRIRSRK